VAVAALSCRGTQNLIENVDVIDLNNFEAVSLIWHFCRLKTTSVVEAPDV
jgi:hypothetical protein